jgi:diguanylate cyclase (GGDEF)-like protein/PAS domain S-box-containing protein
MPASQFLAPTSLRALARSSIALLAARLLCLGVAYYLTARLGLLIPYVGTHVSLVWLPAGVATAAYLRWGSRMGVAVLVAAFSVNVHAGGPTWMAAGISVGNAIGPWLATIILKRLSFDSAFTRRSDLGVYLLAIALGMVVTASNGTAWLCLAGLLQVKQWGSAWLTWWIGDTVGALLGGIPLIVATRQSAAESFARRRGAQNLALMASVLACGYLAFLTPLDIAPVWRAYLLALPLVVVTILALRSGILASTLAVLAMAGVSAWGTAQGQGPFSGHDTHSGLLGLWSYLTALACTSVLVCGLAADLLVSRREFVAMFVHTQDGILRVEPDGRIGAMNPAARDLLSCLRGVAYPSLSDLPRGNGVALCAWLGRPDASVDGPHLQLSRVDGPPMVVEAQTVHFLDARGRRMTHIMLRNVTERHDAQARIAASERRLRDITDSAPALIAEFDMQMRFAFANRTYRDWLGVEPAEMIGRTVREVLGDEEFAKAEPGMKLALLGESADYQRVVQSPGGERHISVQIVPRTDTNGAVLGYYALASDTTQLMLAKRALRDNERLLRSITDHLPMRVSYVDSQERYRFLNIAYEQAFGRPRDTLYGKTVREVIGDGAYSQAGPNIKRALDGEPVSFDSEQTTPEGYRCYHATYVPQFGDDGTTVNGFVAVILNTTGTKLEERRLRELSQVDSLTGLLNRAGFEQRLSEACDRCRATGRTMALMCLDVDGFKQVNDSLGHHAGDTVLRGFAARLVKVLRAGDIIARPGGDEFSIIVEGLSGEEAATTIAANIVQAMKAPFVLETEPVHITTSIGVAAFQADTTGSAHDLARLADQQLYRAKGEGRDRFCIATLG